MYLLIEVAGYINTLPTVSLVMLTAVIGVYLLKRQGLSTLTRGMRRIDGGEIPAQEIAEGLLLAVAGALLITPGFITDGVGFFLLFPPTRMMLAKLLLTRVSVQGASSFQSSSSQAQSFKTGLGGTDEGQIQDSEDADKASSTIEGEFHRRQ